MLGLMMDSPLLISTIAEHAEKFHGDREIASVTMDNPLHRYTMRESVGRARQLANALDSLGLERGDREATIAWNDYRHLEIYYGVSGSGRVCHTINPRLFPDQLIYIINHAEDRYIFTDVMFVPLLEKLLPHIAGVEGFVVMTAEANMPDTSLPNAMCYETLIAGASPDYEWPQFDERTASALCYTSGTTGEPKGVLYDHRSTVLHAYASVAPDVVGLSSRDVVLPVVPLFHVNAWGIPYSALIAGSKLVFPGPKMGDGEALYALIDSERVTVALGVPTVWLGLLQYCDQAGKRMDSLERTIVGGAAVPRIMI
ncbi:MAG: AMP-binding protein, partial [Woeseiaceae bacterium]